MVSLVIWSWIRWPLFLLDPNKPHQEVNNVVILAKKTLVHSPCNYPKGCNAHFVSLQSTRYTVDLQGRFIYHFTTQVCTMRWSILHIYSKCFKVFYHFTTQNIHVPYKQILHWFARCIFFRSKTKQTMHVIFFSGEMPKVWWGSFVFLTQLRHVWVEQPAAHRAHLCSWSSHFTQQGPWWLLCCEYIVALETYT